MKRLFRFRKTVAVLAGAAIAVIVAGVGAVANGGGGGGVTVCFPNGGGAISTEPCDPATESAVTLSTFAPVIRHFEKTNAGPFTQILAVTNDSRAFSTVIRMDGIPNGIYKFESNGFLDDAADLASDEGPTDWQCRLVVQNNEPANINGSVVDYWEAEKLDDATYFLKAALNLEASGSNPTSTVYVECNSGAPSWKASWLKIIAVDAADIIETSGS